jgi:hypothetical protein
MSSIPSVSIVVLLLSAITSQAAVIYTPTSGMELALLALSSSISA